MSTLKIDKIYDEILQTIPDTTDDPICFCMQCKVADCISCYFDLAPDADEPPYDKDCTIIEPPISAVISIDAYLAWDATLDPTIERYLNNQGRTLGDAKAYLYTESD